MEQVMIKKTPSKRRLSNSLECKCETLTLKSSNKNIICSVCDICSEKIFYKNELSRN